jgi:hypothetical protein
MRLEKEGDTLKMVPYTADNPSPRYQELIEQYKIYHKEGDKVQGKPPELTYPGDSLGPWIETLVALCSGLECKTLLDYGCGKGMLYNKELTVRSPAGDLTFNGLGELLKVDPTLYDPAVEEYHIKPEGKYDAVICTDVLEHVPEEDVVDWMVEELFSYANRFVFFNIALFPAQAHLPNGENAHCNNMDPMAVVDLVDRIADKYPHLIFLAAISTPAGEEKKVKTRFYTNAR